MKRARQLEVLRAIVEDYVHSREPVGSKALIERHNLGVSSATVRNDMAALEEQGLITAPHASAGRIPTKDGYRLFVDQIAAVKPLSDPQRRAISSFLNGASDTEQLMDRTVRLLSQLTHQVAVIQYPVGPQPLVKHVDLIDVAPGQAMVLVVLSSAEVLQRVIHYDPGQGADISADTVLISAKLKQMLLAKPLEHIQNIPALVQGEHPLLSAVLVTLKSLVSDSRPSRMAFAGTSYLAQSTEDFPHSIAPILDAFEEQVVVLRLLEELTQDQRGFSVKIGAENQEDPLTDTAVVATGYGHDLSAKIGVVGPTRMDYPANMALVRAVATYLSKTLNH